MKEEKKRWVMPKFLPHKYDVKLISEDKVGVLFTVLKCLLFTSDHQVHVLCNWVVFIGYTMGGGGWIGTGRGFLNLSNKK